MQLSTRRAILLALAVLSPADARAETVYEFISQCREEKLGDCFNQIESHLDRIRLVEQGRAFCLPRVWGPTMADSSSYPVSVLEYVRLGLSAARFGSSARPADDVMGEVLGRIYPCR